MTGLENYLGASALSGGLLGVAGNIASRLFAYIDAEQRARHRLADRDAREISVAADNTMRADCECGAPYPWVDAVRAMVRPVLTLGLAVFLVAAFFALPDGASGKTNVLESLVFASVTAIVWWFCDRAPRRTPPH